VSHGVFRDLLGLALAINPEWIEALLYYSTYVSCLFLSCITKSGEHTYWNKSKSSRVVRFLLLFCNFVMYVGFLPGLPYMKVRNSLLKPICFERTCENLEKLKFYAQIFLANFFLSSREELIISCYCNSFIACTDCTFSIPQKMLYINFAN
jgi:hypothetical protein